MRKLLPLFAIGTAVATFVAVIAVALCHFHKTFAPANHLTSIYLGLHQYRDSRGAFPPPRARDAANGIHTSWRVLLLPYLKHGHTRDDDYRREEPWNSKWNLQLQPSAIYAQDCCWCRVPSKSARYVAVLTPDGEWLAGRDTPGGAHNPVLVVEYTESDVYWSEPRDLEFDGESVYLRERTGGKQKIDVRGLYCIRYDGTLYRFPEEMSEDEIPAAVMGLVEME